MIGGIALLLVLGCNNGLAEELVAEKRMGEIGRSAEKAFYSFMDFIADTLGFRVTAETKKSEVGKYFNSLSDNLEEASKELKEVEKKSEIKSDSSKNLIKEAIDTAKKVLSTLKGHLKSLSQVGDEEVVGDAKNSKGQGTKPDDAKLKEMFDALKGIVDIAKDIGVKALKIGSTTLKVNGGVDNKDGAKILSTKSNDPDGDSAGQAALILASVSGEEILEAIVSSKESDKELSKNAEAITSAISFAKGGQADHLAGQTNVKAAAVAGGIALRSLVKGGKLAAGAASSAKGGEKDVQGVGVTAANKLLIAIEDLIKKTVKNVIGTAKQKIDETRAPKSEGQK